VVVDIDQLTPSATPRLYFTPPLHSSVSTTEGTSEGIHFDINLIAAKPVIVRGFGIESTWNGGLNLQGTAPDFVGNFILDKGAIDITGRILHFTKGKITFDHKINNPYLDLEITKKIEGYDVFVQLQGRPKDPKFTFIAKPGLSQEEVLALILFGRKSATTSLGQLFDVSASLSSLSSAGQDKSFFTQFRKIFGIDALELKNKDQAGPSESRQAISIRKQVSKDLSIVIEQTLNATDKESKSSKAMIEKQLNDNWSVEFEASTNNSGSVGLNWIKRY
jgi:translocation and assembly module TamB